MMFARTTAALLLSIAILSGDAAFAAPKKYTVDGVDVEETAKEGSKGAAWSVVPELFSKTPNVLKSGAHGFAFGAGDHAIDKSKRMKRHPYAQGASKGALKGAQIGGFLGLPAVGAGVGAAIGAGAKLFKRRRPK